MTRKITSTLAALAVSAAALEAQDPADGTAATRAGNAFACSLYGQVGRQPGNLFISPCSVSTALCMTALGAAGKTAAEMATVLQWGGGGAGPDHAAVGRLLADVVAERDAVEIDVANALWVQHGFPVAPHYAELAKRHYGATPTALEFVAQPGSAARAINGWVDQHTRGRISEIVDAGMFGADTRLVLTNAIYFNGRWQEPFDADTTRPRTFRLADGTVVEVPFMQRQGAYAMARDEDSAMLELPYGQGNLAMDILLPDRADGLAALEANLSPDSLRSRCERLRSGRVIVAIPKFTLDDTLLLGQALQALGMVDAFTPGRADFSGLTGNSTELYLQEVVHRAYVQVDEQGTTAAAATAVIGAITSMPPQFIADRPFVFLIRDTVSGVILFMGRMADPRG